MGGNPGAERTTMVGNTCKVDIVVDRYDLEAGAGHESVDDWLLSRWLGNDGVEPVGYRTLTREFNTRLLKQVYDDNGRDTMGPRVDGDYEALTGDDEVLRREVVEDLQSEGIDGERLRLSLVSWGTIRGHLNDCLGAEKPSPEATTDWERESVERAREHALETVHKALGSLSTKGRVERADEVDVEMPVLLTCPACPTRRPLEEALDRGYVCRDHLPPGDG